MFMLTFNLKKTTFWVMMALLLLIISICPHSCYPHTKEDEDPTELLQDEDQGWSEENEDEGLNEEDEDEDGALVEEPTGMEKDPTDAPDCIQQSDPCVKDKGPKCCGRTNYACQLHKDEYICMRDYSFLTKSRDPPKT